MTGKHAITTGNAITGENLKTQNDMNEEEYLFIGELFDELDERGMIIHPDLKETIKVPIIQMIDFLSIKQGINNIQGLLGEREIEEAKQYLRENLTELLTKRTNALQGNLTEYQFWKIKQKLQEALHKDNPYVYQNIFGIKPKGEEEKEKYEFKTKYDFSSALYLDMGLYSGAFSIADKAGDRLIVQYNRNYQESEYGDIPFVEIPTRYNYPIYETFKQSDALRKVLDAMYISIRQAQSLKAQAENSPEFYHYMPSLIDEKDQKSLPLFEKAMSKDGFKFVYCTVGEVLFHLYTWRMLVREIQVEGIDYKVDIKKDSFEDFNINNHDFWEEVRGTHLPEDDWIKTLRRKFKNKEVTTSEGEKIPLEYEWNKYKANVGDSRNYNGTFRMIDEYQRMGLIKVDQDGTKIFTQEFLELVRYTIHAAQKKLNWDIDEIAISQGKRSNKEKDNILRSLHRIERRLDIYYSEPKKIPKYRESGQIHSLYPTIENLEDYIVIKGKKKKEHIIEECFRVIAKHYLLQDENGILQSKVCAKDLLKRLHQRCRFPIIPYYFDLAVGNEHNPREHLVFCLWDSKDNPPIEVTSNEGKSIRESGVVFVSLTVNPIWKIKPEYRLMKNGKSIHCTAALSEESYIRIHRLYDFFRMLAVHIVDKVFYGNLIKKAQRYDVWEREVSALSHELGKISAHLFKYSVFTLGELYENEEEVLQYLSTKLKGTEKLPIEKVREWGIIPNRTRFDSWSLIFSMWAGNNKMLVSQTDDEEKTLGDIIEICSEYAKDIHVASTTLKNFSKEIDAFNKEVLVEKIKDYDRIFNEKRGDLYNLIEPKNHDETLRLCKNKYFSVDISEKNSDEQEQKRDKIPKNAFLRILMAIIVNIHEHTSGDFILRLSEEDNYLTCMFYNKYKKINEDKRDSRGTKPVIESCLNQINNRCRLLWFDEYPETTEGIKKELQLADDESIWQTKVIIDISEILSHGKKYTEKELANH